MDKIQEVILVNDQDEVIGTEEKLKAHQEGKLHRCFSIFIFNRMGDVLLQQRAQEKYHCGGIWSNTCCSHQKKGEDPDKTVHKRLKEEMGFDCPLKEIFVFHYTASFSNGLTENEIDHVYMGYFDGTPKPNPEEVMDWKWISKRDLNKDIKENPQIYSVWMKKALEHPALNSR